MLRDQFSVPKIPELKTYIPEAPAMTTNPPDDMLTRAQLADRYQVSCSTLERLWRARDSNGHPPATLIDGRLHWPGAAWREWYQQLRAQSAPRRAPEELSTDPTELIGPAQFARLCGHRDTTTISHWLTTPPPGFPQPDQWDELPSGRRRPKWRLHTAQAFAAAPRPSRGITRRPAGSRNAPPHPYHGDPRLDLARQLLAQHPQATTSKLTKLLAQLLEQPTSHATLTRLITTARQHPPAKADS